MESAEGFEPGTSAGHEYKGILVVGTSQVQKWAQSIPDPFEVAANLACQRLGERMLCTESLTYSALLRAAYSGRGYRCETREYQKGTEEKFHRYF